MTMEEKTDSILEQLYALDKKGRHSIRRIMGSMDDFSDLATYLHNKGLVKCNPLHGGDYLLQLTTEGCLYVEKLRQNHSSTGNNVADNKISLQINLAANEKNIAKNSSVNAGRDVRIGDDVFVTVNYYVNDKTDLDGRYVKHQDIETAIQPISELIEQNTLQFRDISTSLDTTFQTYSASQKNTENALKALIKGTHL
jgi:hypothetical protein